MIRAINKVIHNGKLYQHGKEILGLTEKEAQRLLELGAAEEEGDTFYEPEPDKDNPLLNDLTTPEQFTKLKAEEQKEFLESLSIDPAGKAEDRVAQFEEWYTEQVTADDQN
ncbi:hypothetical protein JJQ72_06240 [Paenibacillus sp. F411]|uniref:Uncharacterized protein n=1 Tax=Paenibacillus algicola TaxID=2565926 RepID=A0A4P8XQ44_9BACL|nr:MULTISPECIES: hypothetical protein [Paenibacillus]MBO2943576.1 hypothetical protein [Paenibacillus sp. F411]QCT03821.1 hypothetical protein E6C60_3110 [Paenibacillus algicola]